MIRDMYGKRVYKNIEREVCGWGRNVWFANYVGLATTIRRYYYQTLRQAQQGNISHKIGESGRIK